MASTAIIIAGGPWQSPLVRLLKSKGHFVAVVNPVTTETTSLADFHIQSDIRDIDRISSAVEKLRPAFITSDQSDVATRIVAELSNKHGLPGNPPDVVRLFTDKLAMFRFAILHDLPVPETASVACKGDVRRFAEKTGYPLVVKPVDATNSRGVRKLDGPEDNNDEVLLTAKEHSAAGVIVQKFLPGTLATAEGVCSGGKHKTLAISSKEDWFAPGFNSNVVYPGRLPQETLNRIAAINNMYVERSGLKFGLTHGEYIVNGGEVFLLEIGCRGGGAGIADKVTPWVSGVNVYEILYASLTGVSFPVDELRPLARPALLQYYTKRQVSTWSDSKFQDIMAIPGVTDFQYDFLGKQYRTDPADVRHSLGIYLAQNEHGILAICRKVRDILDS